MRLNGGHSRIGDDPFNMSESPFGAHLLCIMPHPSTGVAQTLRRDDKILNSEGGVCILTWRKMTVAVWLPDGAGTLCSLSTIGVR